MRAKPYQPAQQQADAAYDEGKAAFRRDFGRYGPTLRYVKVVQTRNPYSGLLADAWDRGYRQDVRRLIVK